MKSNLTAEILEGFAKWTINNVEHGIYIPLPSPEAERQINELIREAREQAILSCIFLLDDEKSKGSLADYLKQTEVKEE